MGKQVRDPVAQLNVTAYRRFCRTGYPKRLGYLEPGRELKLFWVESEDL